MNTTRSTRLVGALAALTACTSSNGGTDDDPGLIAATQQAYSGPRAGADTPRGAETQAMLDTVVRVNAVGGGSGSGTLIAPLVVLTACHVVKSSSNGAIFTASFSMGSTPVALGSAVSAAPIFFDPSLFTCEGSGLAERDFAILRINPQTLTAADWQQILATSIHRPTFNPVYATGSPASVQAAGYGASSPNRSRATLGTLWSSTGPSHDADGHRWQLLDDATFSDGGDSGGPLFMLTTAADGMVFRDPIGTIKGHYDCSGLDTGGVCTSGTADTYWGDITRPAVSSWISTSARENIDRTAAWYTRHGLPQGQERWFGETEYVGACQVANDPDCDHWYEVVPAGRPGAGASHDNCPNLFNPQQLGGAGGGFGSDCPCPYDAPYNLVDVDGDGFCAFDADGKVTDNCPLVPNDQKNCNQFAEETLPGKTIAGDACDPVPCPAVELAQRSTGGHCDPAHWNPVVGQICMTEAVDDTFHLAPLGPNAAPTGVVVAPGPIRGYVVPGVDTWSYFCKDDNASGFDCSDASVLTDVILATRPPNIPVAPSTPWLPASQVVAVGPRIEHFPMDYGSTARDFQWAYANDAVHWDAQGWLKVKEGSDCLNPDTAGYCLGGSFAFHATTQLGKSVGSVNVGGSPVAIGFHGGVVGEGEDLSNTFTPAAAQHFDWDVVTGEGLLEAVNYHRPLIFTLPDPALYGDPPYERGAGVILEAVDGIPIFGRPTGGVRTAVDFVSPGLRSLIVRYSAGSSATSSLRWFTPEETGSATSSDVAVIAEKVGATWTYHSVRATADGRFALASELGLPNRFASTSTLPNGITSFDRGNGRLLVIGAIGRDVGISYRTATQTAFSAMPFMPASTTGTNGVTYTLGALQSASMQNGAAFIAYSVKRAPFLGTATYSLNIVAANPFASTPTLTSVSSSTLTSTSWQQTNLAFVNAEFRKNQPASLLVVANDFTAHQFRTSRLTFATNGSISATVLSTKPGTVIGKPVLDAVGLHLVIQQGGGASRPVGGSQSVGTTDETVTMSFDDVEGTPIELDDVLP